MSWLKEDARNSGLSLLWIDDAMRNVTFEIETIALVKWMYFALELELDGTLLNHQDLFLFV
jgi:hypothetical protein